MIRCEWDRLKARANERKHGIGFEIARYVFEYPDGLVDHDRIVDGEQRWQLLGTVDGVLLLLVAPTAECEEGEAEVIRIISARRADRKKRQMKKSAKRAAGGRPLTERQRRDIAAMATKPDSEIDYSDMPRLPESFWKNAIRNPFYRPAKRQVTVRLDSDVIAWLRRQGKGYQTRLNYLLRAAMLQDVTGVSNGKR